jgi:hypothetical protein
VRDVRREKNRSDIHKGFNHARGYSPAVPAVPGTSSSSSHHPRGERKGSSWSPGGSKRNFSRSPGETKYTRSRGGTTRKYSPASGSRGRATDKGHRAPYSPGRGRDAAPAAAPAPLPHTPKVCGFWLAGSCKKGDACGWLHPPKTAAPAAIDSTTAVTSPTTPAGAESLVVGGGGDMRRANSPMPDGTGKF